MSVANTVIVSFGVHRESEYYTCSYCAKDILDRSRKRLTKA